MNTNVNLFITSQRLLDLDCISISISPFPTLLRERNAKSNLMESHNARLYAYAYNPELA